ncbi:MAG: electron transfer flavoprotein subunit alpha/FixB family protein [Chloroflexota bacterium]
MILAILDHHHGAIQSASLEMLTAARGLAETLGIELEAVAIGEGAEACVETAVSYGASTVHLIEHDQLDRYAPEAWARSVAQLSEDSSPEAILGVGTERGNEVMAHLAAVMDAPLAANCMEITPGDETYFVTRVRWGGSLLEEANLSGDPKLLTVAAHVLSAAPADSPPAANTSIFSPELDEKAFRVRVKELVKPETDKVSLTDAKIIIGGGRGVGSSEGFEPLEELAALTGGAIGCSRAVTNHGWRPHADQIGQTGGRVAPDLYIACGISGAIQHMAGCKGSKVILAINTDPDASILGKANYAVIGDLHEVIPAISEALRNS